ncbi:GTP pyrophosphokinase family protein [Deinococcus sp. HMF7604]|uniref:GTP pyrophosphokinase n=1 Tax=Deinococcus betulae TaxID=2873312 RepID=UPI001CCCDBE8|nr:GTP pyrophosphokinase family protein [Deinococcus betulae]MBZ9751968.1 GTP pyrophosphokinase family protein [Deinococcus betulae]
MSDPLLTAFDAQLPTYEALRDAAVAHTASLITEAGLNIHHVTGRVKKRASLGDKLRRKPGRYGALADVTDLVAARVITYFESDVGLVARLLEEHHTIDWDNSMDKSKMHDPDRFGYLGVHYVVEVTPQTPGLAAFAGLKFEVQIRSILQHAWAEIEHDLGYKNREAIPREVQRRFYRLAGLLEMADEEFMALHRLSRDYAATLPQRVAEAPDSVFIDAASMTHLLGLPPVRDLDEAVAQALQVPLLTGWPDPERPQRLAQLLHYVGVHSVGALHKELRRHHAEVVCFASTLLPTLRETWTPAGGARPGTSVVHYGLLRACVNPALNPHEIVNLLDLRGVLSSEHLVKAVQNAYECAVASRGPEAAPQPLQPAVSAGPEDETPTPPALERRLTSD